MAGGVLHMCRSSKCGAQLLYALNPHSNQVKNNLIANKKILIVSNSNTRWLSSHSRRLFQKQKETHLEKTVQGIPYKQIVIGVAKESWQNERRVALTPAVAQTFIKKGFTVNVEEDAGVLAMFRNRDYENVGAKIVKKDEIYKSGKVRLG